MRGVVCNNNKNLYVNTQLAKRDVFIADIYCVTTEFDYVRRDSCLARSI